MASVQPVFDLTQVGSGSLNAETWVDLGVIPTGKQILFGYCTFAAEDKTCQFELRSNLATKSAGSVAETSLLDWSSAPGGNSVDRDLYWYGNIATTGVVGSGVEKTWLRVRAQNQSSGNFDYIIHYTLI